MLINGDEASLSAAVAMMSDGFASADDELFAGERFEALVVEACRNRTLDTRREQRFELIEQLVLDVDGQGKQAVQESRDRRKLFP